MTMDDLDRRIHEAMHEVSEDLARDVDDAGVPTLVAGVLRGRMRFFAWMIMVWSFVFFGLSVFFAVRMFTAEELRLTVLYGVGFIVGMHSVGMLKMWFWMQMETGRQLRATKVAELRVLRMLEEMRQRDAG